MRKNINEKDGLVERQANNHMNDDKKMEKKREFRVNAIIHFC